MSRDALITDYFELVGYGPAFFNAALVMTISLVMIDRAEVDVKDDLANLVLYKELIERF